MHGLRELLRHVFVASRAVLLRPRRQGEGEQARNRERECEGQQTTFRSGRHSNLLLAVVEGSPGRRPDERNLQRPALGASEELLKICSGARGKRRAVCFRRRVRFLATFALLSGAALNPN
jgi:hypothetical protein